MTRLAGKRVLLTGAFGFLGSHLTRRLLDAGASLTAWTRLPGRQAEGMRVVQVDLASANGMRSAAGRDHHDAVVHLATPGRQAPSFGVAGTEVGMLGALLDAQQEASLGRLIAFGSADEYGSQPGPQDETTPRAPINPYGVAKAAAADLIRIARTRGADAVLLRPFLVYGAGQPMHMFVSQVMRACRAGHDLEMSHGRQVRDFVHVEDVCEAIVRALEVDHLTSSAYNIGTGEGYAVGDVGELIVRLTGAPIRLIRGAYSRSGDPEFLVANPERAHAELGWTARIRLQDGLQRVIDAGAEDD